MKSSGVEPDGVFFPGFICYVIPFGHPCSLLPMLQKNAEEVVLEV